MSRTPVNAFVSTAALTMPTREERNAMKARGGSKSNYDFSALEVGKSIAVIGRTAKQLTTTLTTVNNGDRRIPLLDDKGKEVMEAQRDAAGQIVKGGDGKPVLAPKTKRFFAVDCNPETDPDKATARIWREQ